MTRRDELGVDDLEWEDPPGRVGAGRGMSPEVEALVDEAKKMIPALRTRPGKWAVLEAFDDVKKATARASSVRKHLKKCGADDDAIERRLLVRAARLLEGGAKIYIQLPKEASS